jgi:hypothetical protein
MREAFARLAPEVETNISRNKIRPLTAVKDMRVDELTVTQRGEQKAAVE